MLLGVEKQKVIDDLKPFTALGLYEQQVLSLRMAAKLAGKAKDEFMDVLAEHGIAALRYPKEELTEELKLLKRTR